MMILAALTLAMCSVTDGDTIRCGEERIRLASIDAPEINGQCPYERDLAQRAKHRLRSLLQRPFDIRRTGTDRYGRTLAYITVNGQSVGQQLVREGLARKWDGARHSWCPAPRK